MKWKESDVSNESYYERPLRMSLKITKDGVLRDIKELIAQQPQLDIQLLYFSQLIDLVAYN